MLQGAIGVYTRAGGDERNLLILDAPGAFELPVLVASALKRKHIAAALALGCIVKGETRHDRVLGAAVTQSLCELSTRFVKPVGLGVLTVENADQAHARAGGDKGNKGAEAMEAVLMTLASLGGTPAKSTLRPDKARRSRAGSSA
jgi:6,7-dimethyl-8-ribityllumazine synthase